MIEIPDSLKTVFTATVRQGRDEYVIEVPASQIENDALDVGQQYRVLITNAPTASSSDGATPAAEDEVTRDTRHVRASNDRGPPVEEGDVLDVEIETIGDQGDGIAKVDRGFVVIVPKGRPGDEVTVRIETVHENMAFAEIIEEDPDVAV